MKKTAATVGLCRQLDVATGKKKSVLSFALCGGARSGTPASMRPCGTALRPMCGALGRQQLFLRVIESVSQVSESC
jgi:hypothetical protein